MPGRTQYEGLKNSGNNTEEKTQPRQDPGINHEGGHGPIK
jgi:hypothetical protein